MNEYPTELELKKITNFNGTTREFIEFISSIWNYYPPVLRVGRSDFDRKKVYKLSMSTAGWSGNEDIIGELHKTMFALLVTLPKEISILIAVLLIKNNNFT